MNGGNTGEKISYYSDWWRPQRQQRSGHGFSSTLDPASSSSFGKTPVVKKGPQTEQSKALRQEISRTNSWNEVLTLVMKHWADIDPPNVATAIHRVAKCAKQQYVDSRTVMQDSRFRQLLDAAGSCFDRWDVWSFANTVWGLATLRVTDQAILLQNISIAVQKVIKEANPQDLCTIVWGFSTLGMTDQALFEAVGNEAIQQGDGFNPQDLAMTTWSFAKSQVKHDALFAAMGEVALNKTKQLRGQNFSNIIWSFATLKIPHPRLFEGFNIACSERLHEFGPQELSNTLWSYATMQIRADRLFELAAPQVKSQVQKMDAQHICNIAWAYSKLGYRIESLFDTLRVESLSRMHTMEPLNVTNLAWAFASCGRSDERTCKRNGLRNIELMEAISNRTLELGITNYAPQNFSNLLWAFATLTWRDERVFMAIGDEACKRMHEFDTQHLANMLWAYATLEVRHVGFALAVCHEMVQRGLEVFSLQDISNMIWGMARLHIEHPGLRAVVAEYIPGRFFDRIMSQEPSRDKGGRTNNAQLAMAIRALFLANDTPPVWRLFERIRASRLKAGSDAYSALLWGAESGRDYEHACAVWAHMADTTNSIDLRAAIQNVIVMLLIKGGNYGAAQQVLQQMEDEGTYNVNSKRLHHRINSSAASAVCTVRSFQWDRRPRSEHEWVEDTHGQKLRLEKREYYKETGALAYAFLSPADDPRSITRAIETFTMEQQLWLKLAADEKGAVLDQVLRTHGNVKNILEVGCYVGYSSSRMVSQLPPESRVVTCEVDPYHACVARNVIDYAGLSDRIEVFIGHSEHTLPQLSGILGERWADMVFFDQRGTRYHEDLTNLENTRLLARDCMIVADNTLKPGAPLFMYRVCCSGPFATQVVELEDFGGSVDDWMTVSYYLIDRDDLKGELREEVPPELLQLAYETDGMRWRSVDERVTMEDWNQFSAYVKEMSARNGVCPAIVKVMKGDNPTVELLPLNALLR